MTEEFSEYYINIGLKVSYFRKKAGLTQEQLAERMGVATSFIGQIEAPNIVKAISLDTLFRDVYKRQCGLRAWANQMWQRHCSLYEQLPQEPTLSADDYPSV